MKRPNMFGSGALKDGDIPAELLARIRLIWERSRVQAARSVNTAHVCANCLIGQQIVEAEQGGARRAGYGQAVLKSLAERLSAEFGGGFSLTALKHMRSFYQAYPDLLAKGRAVGDLLPSLGAGDGGSSGSTKGHSLRDISGHQGSLRARISEPAAGAAPAGVRS
ncbi:DUF1016 N-terminal domain-containing protein [Piscinibacter sp.]|uniref:DUF1016 N-terminal domain-containing protein n=1 Tax=Piscinibacter sp. TaxID=1903157 RepID=UPI002C19B5CC|nr:DUF1016 N-terminal domain-containing protein [Albitalea sp.]HUG22951.1 DUF1016 N-terminal domain-containing protein [Albitalea sp.]